jgi:hypothetical protein
MKFTHIPLLDFIEIEDEQCDVYVHTKDKRMIAFKDVRSDGHLDETGFYVDYFFLEKRMTAFVPREDFSHLEYFYTRKTITKKDFDELNSFIEEQIWDDLV